jgi:hypothetical protein
MEDLKRYQPLNVDLIQIFVHCRPAKHLTVPSHVFLFQCESVVRSAYESPWYEASEGFKRSIRIMVVRSMKPFRLTGGKLYIMSLDTFVAVRYFGASKKKNCIYVCNKTGNVVDASRRHLFLSRALSFNEVIYSTLKRRNYPFQ